MSLDPVSLFRNFLSALDDPGAGDSLYRMHAPDAIVRCDEGLRQAAAVNINEFATAHRTICARHADKLPRFSQPVPLHSCDPNDAGEAVTWFELTEGREARKLVAALGTRETAGLMRVVWATLSPRVQNWSHSDGRLHSVADYPWMRSRETAPARALIDASYFRLYWRSPVRFTSLPEATFTCQMSTVCCKHDFEIALPPEAQLLIDSMPWERIRPELQGTRLSLRPDGKVQLKGLDETCRFLGPIGQCLIHQTLGRQPFGPCCVFPVAFAETPEGVAAALSPICDSTRHGLGSALVDRDDDLRERLVHAEPRRTDRFRLLPGAEIGWESFRDVEKALCEILVYEAVPIRRRLHAGSRLLAALRDQETLDVDRWLGEPPPSISGELRAAIHGMLVRILGWDRAVLRALPRSIPTGLSGKEVREPRVLARILQNTLFSKTYSYPFDLTSAHNFLIVLYLLALLMQESVPYPLTDRMWRELGALGVHGMLKSVLHEGVPDGFRQLFGTAEFGMWMLSA